MMLLKKPAFPLVVVHQNQNDDECTERSQQTYVAADLLKTAFDAGKTPLNFLAHTASLSPTHSTLKVGA